MNRWLLVLGAVLVLALLPAASFAQRARQTAATATNFCLQLNGGPFSGDLGFFRFKGAQPMAAGAIKALTGRGAGLSPAFGSATVAKDGSFSELGVTFFIDATEGQFDVQFFPPSSVRGTGHGDYGIYGVNSSITASVVNCSLEP